MVNVNKIFEEAFDVISDGREEIIEEKKIVFDKKNGQVSIKIPKGLALKNGFNEKTVFEIIYNPKEESIGRAKESGFILFPKKSDDGKREKKA